MLMPTVRKTPRYPQIILVNAMSLLCPRPLGPQPSGWLKSCHRAVSGVTAQRLCSLGTPLKVVQMVRALLVGFAIRIIP